MCDQQWLIPVCAYAQPVHSICLSLEYSRSVKLLNEHHLEILSLKESCKGSSESTLVKMPLCWKSYVTAQLILCTYCVFFHMSAQIHAFCFATYCPFVSNGYDYPLCFRQYLFWLKPTSALVYCYFILLLYFPLTTGTVLEASKGRAYYMYILLGNNE